MTCHDAMVHDQDRPVSKVDEMMTCPQSKLVVGLLTTIVTPAWWVDLMKEEFRVHAQIPSTFKQPIHS